MLRLFYYICQAPTLTEAGKYLNLSQSNLSRYLANLEASLGYRLFSRSQRALVLTPEGQELLTLVTPIFHQLTQYQARFGQQNQAVQGTLKMLIAPHLPVSWLMRSTPQFLTTQPQLSFHLRQEANFLMYYTQYVDCAIQVFDAARQDDLIQRPLCRLSYGLYTCQEYLNTHDTFEHIDDLQHHPKLVVKIPGIKDPFGWPTSVPCDPQQACVHEFSSAQDMFEATRQGLGIAALPRRYVALCPDLVAVPFYMTDPVIDLYYAYPKYYQDLRRVTLYGDFLEQNFDHEKLE